MTRIIAGAIGSFRLKGAAKATRPTSDMVKESFFAKLDAQNLFENAVVLDLFAGTGALGLEAISRGASEALFIESDKAAYALLKTNVDLAKSALENQKIRPKLETKHQDAAIATKSFRPSRFSLVFVDPPYDLPNQFLEEILLVLLPSLVLEATIVVERSSKALKFAVPEGYGLREIKTYGDTSVTFLGNRFQAAGKKP
jgi:16S rRNA (guanine966-N2)-methyltransferase